MDVNLRSLSLTILTEDILEGAHIVLEHGESQKSSLSRNENEAHQV